MNTLLRWLLLVPASALAALSAGAAVRILGALDRFPSNWLTTGIHECAAMFVTGAVLIWALIRIAPSGKRLVAQTGLALWVVIFATAAAVNFGLILYGLAGVIGAFAAYLKYAPGLHKPDHTGERGLPAAVGPQVRQTITSSDNG